MFGGYIYCSILFHFVNTVPAFSITDLLSKLDNLKLGRHQMNPLFHQNEMVDDPTDLISDILGDVYTSANIRGGNSKFKYIPPKNYREVFVYQLSQFEGQLGKNPELLSSILALLPKRKKRNALQIVDHIKYLQNIELGALSKGIFTVCRWAFPFPSHPLGMLNHCTQAELKSVLTD